MRRLLAIAVLVLLGACATAPPPDEPVFPPPAPGAEPEPPPPVRAEPAVDPLQLRLTGADRGELAGVKVGRLAQPDQLTQVELDRILGASRAGRMPLSFVLYLEAANPRDNPTSARIEELAWTLYLDRVKTIGGVVEPAVQILPGSSQVLVLNPSLDLRQYFDRPDSELVVLAIEALERGSGRLELEVRPVSSGGGVPVPDVARLRLE